MFFTIYFDYRPEISATIHKYVIQHSELDIFIPSGDQM